MDAIDEARYAAACSAVVAKTRIGQIASSAAALGEDPSVPPDYLTMHRYESHMFLPADAALAAQVPGVVPEDLGARIEELLAAFDWAMLTHDPARWRTVSRVAAKLDAALPDRVSLARTLGLPPLCYHEGIRSAVSFDEAGLLLLLDVIAGLRELEKPDSVHPIDWIELGESYRVAMLASLADRYRDLFEREVASRGLREHPEIAPLLSRAGR